MTRHRFGGFTVDTDLVEVIGPDGSRDFEPQVYSVLLYLIEQHGRLVTKEELLDNVWGDRFVSESTLTTRIKQVRQLLDDDGRTQWAIKTVHSRGYRFTPEVTTADGARTAGTSAADGPPQLPDALRADARQLFCGRETEIEQAAAVFDRSATEGTDNDPFGWVWLLGEPGIGKTRLAAELSRMAHERGHRVLFGGNNEDLRVPYQPFIEVIRSALGQVDSARRAEVQSSLPAEFAPLLPEFGGAESSDGQTEERDLDSSAVDDSARRYALYEAITEWLTDAASERPVTMIIDDVHWAADSTLQLVAHLQQRHVGGAVTFVVTSRDTAPDINPRVADLLAAGQGARNSTVVHLGGLSGDAALKLIGGRVELDDVMHQTAGNPLLLQAVNPDDGSVDLQSAVRRRLANLDQSVRDTLGLSSVIGLEFELVVTAGAARRDELDVLDDLEQAVAARVLVDVGVDRFRFAHALVRSSLRDELSSARLSRLHGRIAEELDKSFPDDPLRLPALAFHTARAAASDPTLRSVAIERLERSADVSMQQLSFEEAAAQLQRARTLAGATDTPAIARLSLQQGIAETRAGRNLVAVRTFATAIAAATDASLDLLRVEAALRYEDAAWRPGIRDDHALRHVDDAIGILDASAAAGEEFDDVLQLRARLATARLRALALSGNTAEADAAFAGAHALTRQLGVASIEAWLLNVYLTQVRIFRGLDGTDELVDRLTELEPEIDDSDVALHTIHSRLLLATLTGRFDRQQELIAKMAELQERSHSAFWAFIRTNQAAMEAFYAGDLDASEQLAERCLTLAESVPEEDGSGVYGLRMFLIRREQDQLASMAPVVRHVLSRHDLGGVWTPGLALLLIETGAPAEAAEALAAIKENSFDLPIDAMWSTVMVLLIESYVQLGDVEACTALRDRLTPLAGTNITTGSGLVCFGRADRYLGMLSYTIGDLEEAESSLGIALEADDAGGSKLWCNESRLWMSRVRRAQGYIEEADAMLTVVRREAAAAGLARLERLASSELTS